MLIHNSIRDDDHIYEPSTIELIKNTKGIDLVLGGHAHKIINGIRAKVNSGVNTGINGKALENVKVRTDKQTKQKTYRSLGL